MADSVRINGNQYDWGSITIKVDAEVYSGFDQISYGDKRERTYSYGTGRHRAPRGRTGGKYTPEPVKLRGMRSTMQVLRAHLASKSPDGRSYGNVEFPICVQYVEPGSATELPMLVELERCVIVGDTTSDEENTDPSKEEVEISTMLVRRNGLSLFDASRGAP